MLDFQLCIIKFIPPQSIFKGNQSTDTHYLVKEEQGYCDQELLEANLSMKKHTVSDAKE